jgi:hypothetical protein
VDTSDGHLRFRHNGSQKFVVHKPDAGFWGNRVWAEEVGYLTDAFVKNGDKVTIRSVNSGRRLQHYPDDDRARFDNANRGTWEEMVVEKFV